MSYKHVIPFLTLTFLFILTGCNLKTEKKTGKQSIEKPAVQLPTVEIPETKVIEIDTVAFQNKLRALANGDTSGLWPNNLRFYPLAGHVLPYKRIVAFYGNLYSRKMLSLIHISEPTRRTPISYAVFCLKKKKKKITKTKK